MIDDEDKKAIEAAYRLLGGPATSEEDNTHTLAPDPEGLIEGGEETGGSFNEQIDDLLSDPAMRKAAQAAQWGTAAIITVQQNEVLLCNVSSEQPTSWIVQCLPDDLNVPPDPNLRYRILYGSGGARRDSGLLAPGMWICHGSSVQVLGNSAALAVNQVRFQAFITPSPGAIPNIP